MGNDHNRNKIGITSCIKSIKKVVWTFYENKILSTTKKSIQKKKKKDLNKDKDLNNDGLRKSRDILNKFS